MGLASFHEVWRDEVSPMTAIADSKSFAEVLHNTRNWGHPPLWYALLYPVYRIYPHFDVVKIVNLLVCVSGVFVFLRFAPFIFYQKILFLLGYFLIYEYPILNRNYGVSMLLIFSLASLYKDRARFFITFCVILTILAQAHAHSWIFVLVILSMLIGEKFLFKKISDIRTTLNVRWIVGTLFVATGIGLFVVSVNPDPEALLFHHSHIQWPELMQQFFSSLIHPGQAYPRVFGLNSAIISTVVIFFMGLYLIPKPKLLYVFGVSVLALSVFAGVVYPNKGLRHEGMLWLLMIFIFWIERYELETWKVPGRILSVLVSNCRKHANKVFVLILVMQIVLAVRPVKRDIFHNYSAYKPFSQFLHREHPELTRAIFTGEWPALLEAIPYYFPEADIYFYREKALRRFSLLTTKNMLMSATLDDLLDSALMLQKEYKRPVIIILDCYWGANGPYEISLGYNRYFKYSLESWVRFQSHVEKLAEYKDAIIDEKFIAYLLK
jgi:hypothetical protein